MFVPHNLRPCAFAQHMAGMDGAEAPKYLYRSNRSSPNLCKSCLLRFAGKLDFGCVGAMSATDLSILSFTGVARKAWMSPACGPLSTVAMPEICPRSLILLA